MKFRFKINRIQTAFDTYEMYAVLGEIRMVATFPVLASWKSVLWLARVLKHDLKKYVANGEMK